MQRENLRLVRMAWADPHGASRAKAVTIPAFIGALANGYNINVATTTLDSANARTFSSFTRGGGMGSAEMTGSPNLTIVPDPNDVSGAAVGAGRRLDSLRRIFQHAACRFISRRGICCAGSCGGSRTRECDYVVGLEIEWYLLRIAQDELGDENIGAPGVRARPLNTARPSPAIPIIPNPTWT